MRPEILATNLALCLNAAAHSQCSELRAWGTNSNGALQNIPTAATSQVSSNYHLSVGLDVAGQVHCWGSPDLRSQMPQLQGVRSVCAGVD